MSKIFWKSLLVSPAILGVALAVSSTANAAESLAKTEAMPTASKNLQIAQAQSETTTDNTQLLDQLEQSASTNLQIAQAQSETTTDNTQLLDQLEQYSTEGQPNSNDQVTSVNELRDVSPTAWAYEALRSLVERYGCIVGYPDRTFRGDRALTRWEFAAGLNACMNTMERLIQEGVGVLREDIETLKKLMEEFQAELAALGARVDNLEGRVAFLEDHQFSTTTKLSGEAIFALTDTFGSDDDTQTVFGDRVRLEFNTSFTGDDRLVTRLAAGNLNAFETTDREIDVFDPVTGDINSFDVNETNPETTQTFNIKPGDDNDVAIDWLAYYKPFALGENFTLNTYIAAFGGIHSDYVPTINPYFEDYDGGNGALSTFASESPIYRIGGGAGAALSFQLGFLESVLGPSTLTFGYLAGDAGDPNEGSGLFNGDYAALGQLNVALFDRVNLGLTYVHGFHKSDNAIFGLGGQTGVVGTSFANLAETTVDFDDVDFNFDVPDKVSNSYGGEVAFKITDNISLSGFFGYTNVIAIGEGSRDIWYYGGGVAFADLGKEGSVLGLFGGVQPYLGSGIGDFNEDFKNDNPIHIEAFYKYQLTDNISITPGVIYLINPQQSNDNDDVWIGTLRTTFSF